MDLLPTDSESENYRRLGILLLEVGTSLVQEIFRRRRNQLLPKPCTNFSGIGSNFSEEGQNAFSSMSADQKSTLQNEDISSWDLTSLLTVLTHTDYTNKSPSISLDHHRENGFIKELEEIHHKYARSSKRRISHRKFKKWWKRAETALITLGVSEVSIKEVKESGPGGIVKSFQNFDLPIQNFTGRQDLLHKIHSLFNTCCKNESCEDRIVLLRGVGGIGKSELARMYAYTYIEDPIIQNIAWIDAEQQCTLKASFTSLAKRLGLITDGKEIDEIVKNVYEHFSEHVGVGLFIFDNSQSEQPFGIFKYLPKQYLQRRPLLLITGEREKQWEISKENILAVDKLSESESIDLLSKKFELTTNENDQEKNGDYQSAITKLARALQGYPLGLALVTSNIDAAEWTDFKVEIQAYLEKIKEPEPAGDVQQKCELPTNYQAIIENVFEVTLKKIQALGSVGINSIKVLNIIAYLPPNYITIDKVGDIFKFSFKKSPFSTKLLHILEKFSLVSVFKGKYKKENEVHRIRIHPLVQRCAREKLDSESDFSYLLWICKYLSHQGLQEDNKKNVEIKETLLCFHEYLKTRKWPEKSIIYSVMFCSLLVPSYMDFSAAFIVAQDVYNYLEFGSTSSEQEMKKGGMDSDVLNLFLMCLFRIKYSGKYPWHRMFKDLKLSNEKLEKLYLSLLKPAIEQVMVSKTDDIIVLPQLHCYKFCFELVSDIITHSKFQKTKRSFKTEIWNIFLATVNGARGCSLENTHKIYGLQTLCFSHDRKLDCIRCMEIMFKKHSEVYHDLRKTNKGSGKQLKKYWNSEGPLQLFGLIDICEFSHAGKKEAILDSFFFNGGLQIVVEYISYLCKYDVMETHPFLFEFISKLAYDLNCDEKFIQDTEFIKVYQKLTKMLAERKHEDSLIYQFFCLTSWFALFARHTHCENISGSEFSIDSLATEFSTMLQNLEQEGPVKYTHWYCIYNDIDILKGFLDKYKNEPKCLAAETAVLYIKLIKYICMESLEIQNNKIKMEDKLHNKEAKEDSEVNLVNETEVKDQVLKHPDPINDDNVEKIETDQNKGCSSTAGTEKTADSAYRLFYY